MSKKEMKIFIKNCIWLKMKKQTINFLQRSSIKREGLKTVKSIFFKKPPAGPVARGIKNHCFGQMAMHLAVKPAASFTLGKPQKMTLPTGGNLCKLCINSI